MAYDIITFGSAAQDIYVKSKFLKTSNKDVCLDLGSKIDVEDVTVTTGGGGTNTAATFAKQGFKTAFCGAIGKDIAGTEIIKELKKLGVDTKLIIKSKENKTNTSVIISSSSLDRTILVYRGASEAIGVNEIPWKKIKKAKWFYIAPLTGLLCDTFGEIVDFAKRNGISIAINPSKQQLSLPVEQLGLILKKVDILFLNQEEASYLTKISFENEVEIFKEIDKLCPGIAVMTKGGQGVVASDGKYLYGAPGSGTIKTNIVDTTGAGDAFASGFLSDYIRTNGDIEKAIQLGLANGLANLNQVGAKTGILSKKDKFERIPVTKQECGENNLCINK
jgi:ribokinase